MREVKIFGDPVNCEPGEDSRDFVERVLTELGEPSGQHTTSVFRGSGAVGKGFGGVIG